MKPFNLLAALLVSVATASFASSVEIQILAINDFHGNLEQPSGSVGKIAGIDAGGAEFLATHLQTLRQGHPHTITVSAGDLFGASPLLSAMFHEEPTIEAMNLMGLDLNAVGNHEFDKGFHQLLRVAQADPARDYPGAQFGMLAANVMVNETGKTLFPAYQIRDFAGAKMAFVGLVVQGIDLLVPASAIEGLTFLHEADAVNALIPELTALGVNAVVVLIHEGGYPTGGYNDCPGISGPIVAIAQHLHDNVGVVLSGHTHHAYNCKIGNKLVTSAASNGRLVTDVSVTLDAQTNSIIAASADNIIVTRTVAKDDKQTALIDRYKSIAAPIINRVVGQVTEDFTKIPNDAGESMLGKMLADAQQEATKASTAGLAEIAFINPGGIRTDISYPMGRAGEGDGNVTFGEVYAVQPFGNILITMSLSGAQIIDVLEQQFAGCGFDQTRILQVSKGFRYTYDENARPCEKIVKDSIMVNDQPLDTSRIYRVVANSFLASGGDGFAAFKQGASRTVGVTDIEALQAFLSKRSPLRHDEIARIKRCN